MLSQRDWSEQAFDKKSSQNHLSWAFDWEFYVEYYEDLRYLSNFEEAYQHWIQHGQFEKRYGSEDEFYEQIGFKKSDLPEDFDCKNYLSLNPDVKQVYGNNKYKVIQHFLQHGEQEQREYNFSSPVAHYKLGEMLTRIEQWDEAIAAYLHALKLRPDLSLHRRLGETFMSLHRWDEAAQTYRQALKINPELQWAHRGLGDALSSKGLTYEAMESYQCALKLQTISQFMLPNPQAHYLSLNHADTQVKTATKPIHQFNRSTFYRVGIKICAPHLREGYLWGDFHYANSLKRAFEQLGHTVRIDCQDAWNTNIADQDDVVIVLRGRHQYIPKAHQISFLWMISHPDRVSNDELNAFDHIFVASATLSQKLAGQLKTSVSCMYQCTDPALFYPMPSSELPTSKVLFVGSSRNVFRPIVQNCVKLDIDLDIYGPLWEQFVPQSLIKGTYIPNDQLHKYYSNCKILLNDHWDTMRQEGFLSNRLFDASACATFVITDRVLGLHEIFGDSIETYEHAEDLRDKIAYYTQHEQERYQKAERARIIVLENHTFEHRVKQFLVEVHRLQESQQQTQITNTSSKGNARLLKNSVYWNNFRSLGLNAIATTQKKVDLLQQQFFHSNLSGLEYGLRNISTEPPVFYEWIWRIQRQTDTYKDFISKFVDSETRLLHHLSTPATWNGTPPLVSIIMPTFNRAYVIADGIQSVLDQTYEYWELFVCDDGSTDNTKGVIEQFQDPRIHYFQLPKANGAVARNHGLRHASGKYIAYLDSDNIWHPQHLWLCIQNLESKPSAMSCYTGYVDAELVKTKVELQSLSYQSFEYYKLLNKNFIDLNSLVHHRNLFDWLGGFDEVLVRLQDWDLALRYTFLFEPMVIPHYTVFYRRNVAWSQVTKLYADLDVKSIVQKKALGSIEKHTLSLDIQTNFKPRVCILCSDQSKEDWLRALAIATVLSSTFDVQLLTLTLDLKKRSPLQDNAFSFKLIKRPNLIGNTLSIETFNDEEIQACVHSVLSAIQGDILMVFSRCVICSTVALLSEASLSLEYSHHHELLQKLHQIIHNQDDSIANLSHAKPDSEPFKLTEIVRRFEEHPLTLMREMNSEDDDPFAAITICPTLLDGSVRSLINPIEQKTKLGFDKKDYVIAFWSDPDTAYIQEELEQFLKQVGIKQCKLLLIREARNEAVNNEVQRIQTSANGVRVITVENEQQAIEVLKGVDICVLWRSKSLTDSHSRVTLPFVYALAAGCIPVTDDVGEYSTWASVNYCLVARRDDWNLLSRLCRELHANSKRLSKLKNNTQRLYNLRFSSAVVRERIKYLVYKNLTL
ncbi:MAG: glycosyltransferase [Cyanobacteria bacterium CRU_2_1]|nr:glycosyltransferase [Cyanobacteria bacterium CRU_2_1]